jgi:hypothetical protein
MTEQCGFQKANGEPCELPPSRPDDRCHHHTDHDDKRDNGGRPPALAEQRKQQIIYTAVNSGLTVKDQAALAQVSPDTLRRALCCVETPRTPEITAPDPCDFCEGYAQAHARGAMEILQECKPEFRASATFGYVEKSKQELTGEDGDAIKVTSDVVTVTQDDL